MGFFTAKSTFFENTRFFYLKTTVFFTFCTKHLNLTVKSGFFPNFWTLYRKSTVLLSTPLREGKGYTSFWWSEKKTRLFFMTSLLGLRSFFHDVIRVTRHSRVRKKHGLFFMTCFSRESRGHESAFRISAWGPRKSAGIHAWRVEMLPV